MMKRDNQAIAERNGITYRIAPNDGRQAVEARLKNIIKLAIEIGQKQVPNEEPQGGEDVTD